jgi:hypothetical protein
VDRLRDGIETTRTCRLRRKSESFIMPDAGSIARRMKSVAVVMRLKRWLLDLVATVKTKRCLLKKSQASNFPGHFLRTPTLSGV